MTPEAFQTRFSTSNEVLLDLKRFSTLLVKWNKRINLISKSTESDLWQRHFADSACLTTVVDPPKTWCDLGSGGGFPGLIVAILLKRNDTQLTLIEADTRKAAFLKEATRQLALNVTVLDQRIEAATPQNADVISARALAPLDQLLEFATLHGHSRSVCLFPKGARVSEDLHTARSCWTFDHTIHPSASSAEGVILRISEIARV